MSRVCTGSSNNPDIFRYAHFLPLMRRTISLRIPWAADPHGKRQHVVETLNIIDKGTSVLVAHHVRSDFTAETARQALAETFSSHGLPASITLDRDTRWVGAPQGSDFPAAQVALLSFPRGCSARLRSASPATKWVCRKISSQTSSSNGSRRWSLQTAQPPCQPSDRFLHSS